MIVAHAQSHLSTILPRYLKHSQEWFLAKYYGYGQGLSADRYDDLDLDELRTVGKSLYDQGWSGRVLDMNPQLSFIAMRQLVWEAYGLEDLFRVSPYLLDLVLRYKNSAGFAGYEVTIIESLRAKVAKHYEVDGLTLGKVLVQAKRIDKTPHSVESNIVRLAAMAIIENAQGSPAALFGIFQDVVNVLRQITTE